MRIRVSCPSCGAAFTVSERHAGKRGRCPAVGCDRTVRVPTAQPLVEFESAGPRPAASRSAAAGGRNWGAIAAGLAAVAAVAAGVFAFWPRGGDPTPAFAAVTDSIEKSDAAEPPADAAPPAPAGDGVSRPAGRHGGAAAGGAPPLVLTSLVQPEAGYADGLQPFLTKYCVDCHGPDYAEADIDFGAVDSVEDLRGDREKWERILSILKVGAMPPSEMDQPAAETRAAAVDWIDRALHEVDCEVVNDPGRVTVRRLNRTEYDNTIRDLIGLDLTLSDDFPGDDVGNGFDNQGEVLTLPPLLLEKYLAAAERIAEKAIVGDLTTLMTQRKETGDHRSVQAVKESFRFPKAGDYTVRIHARAQQAGSEKARYAATLAGIPLAEVTLRENKTVETFERTIPVKAGTYPIEIEFLNDFYKPEAKLDRNLYVSAIEVVGPLGELPDELPEIHASIVTATPRGAGGVKNAAEAVFRPLMSRAYRRPATDLEVQRVAGLVEAAVRDGRTYEQGVQLGLQVVLCSPHFLFRIERDPDDVRPGEPAGLNGYELASRLSYFLWSSMPDDRLLKLAGEGKLARPDVLSAEVDRMLGDPKSEALVEGFFAQWLNLRTLEEFEPDGRQFRPYWNTSLRRSMRRETELFCREVVRENLPVGTFLDADFTFVNPRLAEFYGLPWEGKTGEELARFYVDGLPGYITKDGKKLRKERARRAFAYPQEFEYRRVPLPATRRGILTHGSILALTSNPTETSPVKRGKWILDNILGASPPPPPPDVPALEETREANKNLSPREALAKHREDPGCASCHAVMDPLGFAFENFDAVGRWRTADGEFEIDASGELPGGRRFDGARELVEILEDRSDEFVDHFARQLLTYALGRQLEWYDRCSVDGIVESARPEQFRFRALVRGVVLSDPFRKRKASTLAAN